MNLNAKTVALPALAVCGLTIAPSCAGHADGAKKGHGNDQKMNIVLLTADDLGWMSLGCYGSRLDVTPNLDRLASEGVAFDNGYVNAAISSPSRKIIMTGMFGHNSGAMGFDYIDRSRNVPILADILKDNGYKVGILGKVPHSNPYEDYPWDYQYDYDSLGRGRNPGLYARRAAEFLQQCKEEGKPFYFMINSHDPHRPYHNPDDPAALAGNAVAPSKLFSPEEIEVPGFLPDDPQVRKELACYYNSTRRMDDTIGAVLQELEKAGVMDNTLIVFLSDNGVALPFAKANAYYASNRVPFIIKYPGAPVSGVRNAEDFICEVDLLPTFLDLLGIDIPGNVDGKSFRKVIEGKWGTHRTYTFNQIDAKISGPQCPMRSIITKDWCYIFNAWVDGNRTYRNNNEGMTFKAMERLAKDDPFIASRVHLFRYRTEEEFYDMNADKSSLKNLIDDPELQKTIGKFRKMMEKEMVEHADTLLPVFRARGDFKLKEELLKKAYPRVDEPNKKK